jgi:hypothetical protein
MESTFKNQTALTVNINVFSDVTPCNLLKTFKNVSDKPAAAAFRREFMVKGRQKMDTRAMSPLTACVSLNCFS